MFESRECGTNQSDSNQVSKPKPLKLQSPKQSASLRSFSFCKPNRDGIKALNQSKKIKNEIEVESDSESDESLEAIKKEKNVKLLRLDKFKRVTNVKNETKRCADDDNFKRFKQKMSENNIKLKEDETHWEYTEICGKIVSLPTGQSALSYIYIKRNGKNVIIQQEIANDDNKRNDLDGVESNIQIIRNRHFFNECIAEQFAKNVFARFINDGCFKLSEA